MEIKLFCSVEISKKTDSRQTKQLTINMATYYWGHTLGKLVKDWVWEYYQNKKVKQTKKLLIVLAGAENLTSSQACCGYPWFLDVPAASNLAMTGLFTTRVRFQNAFEVYSSS